MYFKGYLSLYETYGGRLVKNCKNGRLFRNSVGFRTNAWHGGYTEKARCDKIATFRTDVHNRGE